MRSRWLGRVCMAVMLGFGFAVHDRLPERVPIHWNVRGEVDGWSGRLFAVLFAPAVGGALWLLFVALLLPPVAAFVLMMTSQIGATLGLIAYSYVLWRGRHRPGSARG